MTILGIDPGTERTGYGLIRVLPSSGLECVTYGCITTSRSHTRSERLVTLEKELSRLLKKHKPSAAAVETLFFFKNLKTVMPVSEARGVILWALAKQKIPIYEFSPLQVKMGITGYGRAEKTQMQGMVQEILQLDEIPKPDDAADGLSTAIACSLFLRNERVDKKGWKA